MKRRSSSAMTVMGFSGIHLPSFLLETKHFNTIFTVNIQGLMFIALYNATRLVLPPSHVTFVIVTRQCL